MAFKGGKIKGPNNIYKLTQHQLWHSPKDHAKQIRVQPSCKKVQKIDYLICSIELSISKLKRTSYAKIKKPEMDYCL